MNWSLYLSRVLCVFISSSPLNLCFFFCCYPGESVVYELPHVTIYKSFKYLDTDVPSTNKGVYALSLDFKLLRKVIYIGKSIQQECNNREEINNSFCNELHLFWPFDRTHSKYIKASYQLLSAYKVLNSKRNVHIEQLLRAWPNNIPWWEFTVVFYTRG